MVGNQNDEHVVPRLCLFQPFYQFAQTMIGVCKRVQDVVVEGFEGHFERLVAAKREVGVEPRRFQLANLVESAVACKLVLDSPSVAVLLG